jgi:hypothetical protein
VNRSLPGTEGIQLFSKVEHSLLLDEVDARRVDTLTLHENHGFHEGADYSARRNPAASSRANSTSNVSTAANTGC